MSWTACVVRIHRKGKVERYLADTEKFVIGRSPDCDFPIVDNQISRHHLGFLIRKGSLYIKDLGSANGSFLGDQRVPNDVVIPYPENAEVRLGKTNISISVELLEKKVELKTAALFEGPGSEKLIELLSSADAKFKSLYSEYEHLITQTRSDLDNEIISRRAEIQKEYESTLNAAKAAGEAEKSRIIEGAVADGERIVSDARKHADEQAIALVKVAEHTSQERMAKATAEAESLLTKSRDEALIIENQAGQCLRVAEQKFSSANTEAEKIVSAARIDAESLLQKAQTEAHKILTTSKDEAARVIQHSKDQFGEKVAEAEALLSSTKLEAEKASQRILADVQAQVEKREKEFDARKTAELEHARREIEYTKSQLQAEHQRVVGRLESDFQLKAKLFEEECVIRRKQVERSLQSELDKVEDARKQHSQVLSDIKNKESHLRQLTLDSDNMQATLKQRQDEVNAASSAYGRLNGEMRALREESERVQAATAETVEKRKTVLNEIQNLKMNFQSMKESFEKEAYDLKLKAQVDLNSVRQKENEDIQRYRLEEIDKIDQMRKVAAEEIVKNKAVFKVRLSEKIEAKVVSLLKAHGSMPELPGLQKEVFELVQNSIEEQSFELAQGHEADIRRLVSEETGKRKSALRRVTWIAATGVAVIAGVFVYLGGDLTHLLTGVNQAGETAAEEAGRKMREERQAQKFSPPQSDFIKSTYTDNVLYTRNFVTVYNEPQLQEKWIRELNQIFSKEWGLDDDAVVKFVAAESTLIARLQLEKESVVTGYEQIGIDKMRKVEKESVDQMKGLLKDSFRMRKFQSISEKFWHEALKERLPASNR